MKPESDNSFTRHVRTQCSSGTEDDVVVRSPVAQAPRSAWVSSADFPPTISTPRRCNAPKSRPRQSQDHRHWHWHPPAFGHLTVGAGRILANLEISSPVRTSRERVSWKGDRGQTRATFSNFQFPRSPPRVTTRFIAGLRNATTFGPRLNRQQPLLVDVRSTSRDTSIYSASRSPGEQRQGSQPSEPGRHWLSRPARRLRIARSRRRGPEILRVHEPWLTHARRDGRHGSLWAAGPPFLLGF